MIRDGVLVERQQRGEGKLPSYVAVQENPAIPTQTNEAKLLPCSERSTAQSEHFDDYAIPTSLRVANATDEDLYLRWIDPKGNVFVHEMDPVPQRGTRDRGTRIGHVFVLEDSSGTCITLMQPRATPSTYVHRSNE